MIGTQIVSKGHNFPHLTLVGVIDADLGLQGGDCGPPRRLSADLPGRGPGRASRVAGLALIQTHQPSEHPAIRAIRPATTRVSWRVEAEQARRCRRRAALLGGWWGHRDRHRRGAELGRGGRSRPSCCARYGAEAARAPAPDRADPRRHRSGCWSRPEGGVVARSAPGLFRGARRAGRVDIDPQSFFDSCARSRLRRSCGPL